MIPVERWRELPAEERAGLRPLGIIHRVARPDLQSTPGYADCVARSRKAVEAAAEELEAVEPSAALPELRPLRTCLRFAGSGGQGVITAGEIALSAAVRAGKNGVFTKNYGPEARGGEAYSDVTVSDGETSASDQLDVLVALNQGPSTTARTSRQRLHPGQRHRVQETYNDARVVASPIGERGARGEAAQARSRHQHPGAGTGARLPWADVARGDRIRRDEERRQEKSRPEPEGPRRRLR